MPPAILTVFCNFKRCQCRAIETKDGTKDGIRFNWLNSTNTHIDICQLASSNAHSLVLEQGLIHQSPRSEVTPDLELASIPGCQGKEKRARFLLQEPTSNSKRNTSSTKARLYYIIGHRSRSRSRVG
jgi:hypothetical protein